MILQGDADRPLVQQADPADDGRYIGPGDKAPYFAADHVVFVSRLQAIVMADTGPESGQAGGDLPLFRRTGNKPLHLLRFAITEPDAADKALSVGRDFSVQYGTGAGDVYGLIQTDGGRQIQGFLPLFAGGGQHSYQQQAYQVLMKMFHGQCLLEMDAKTDGGFPVLAPDGHHSGREGCARETVEAAGFGAEAP